MKTKTFPLASNQKDIWFDQAVWPESPLYNIGGYLRINGEVTVPVLESALQQLIAESDALRISIKENSETDEVLQTVADCLDYKLECIDFSSEDTPEIYALSWIKDAFQIPFTVHDNSALWQFSLLKINSNCYFLMTKYHHLIADGWTTKIVISRLAELYNALLYQRTAADGSVQCYINYLEQEQSYLCSDLYKKDEQYWHNILPELPPSLIEQRHISDNKQTLPKAHIHRFFIPRSFYNQLEDFSKKNKVTTYHLLLSTIALYFSRIYGRDSVLFGVPSLNRSGARYKDVLGMFISLSPLCLNVGLSDSVESLIKQCGKTLRDNYRHQRFPLGEINKRLGMIKQQRNSLFDVVVSYERQEYTTPFGTASISAHQQFSGVARYPLGVTICEFNDYDDVEIILEGAESSFSNQELKNLGLRFIYLLEQMISAPQSQPGNIDLLPEPEKKLLFEQFNANTQIQSSSNNVVTLFQQQAALNPQNLVLESNQGVLTYQ